MCRYFFLPHVWSSSCSTVAMRQLVPLGSNPPPPNLKQSKPLFSLLSAHFCVADAILKTRWGGGGGDIIFSARPPCRTCNTPSSFRPRSSPLQLNKFSSFLSSPFLSTGSLCSGDCLVHIVPALEERTGGETQWGMEGGWMGAGQGFHHIWSKERGRKEKKKAATRETENRNVHK